MQYIAINCPQKRNFNAFYLPKPLALNNNYNNVVLMYQWWTSIKICSIPIL